MAEEEREQQALERRKRKQKKLKRSRRPPRGWLKIPQSMPPTVARLSMEMG
jgi:hypothetical protein